MAVLTAQNAQTPFYMSSAGHVVPELPLGATANSFGWRTAGVPLDSGDPATPSQLYAAGTGFTYNPVLIPTGGVVSIILIDLFSTGNSDVSINMGATNVVGGLPALYPTTGTAEEKAQQFWSSILSGNDTLIASQFGNGDMTGDFFQVVSTFANPQSLTGGNDNLSATNLSPLPIQLSRGESINALCGDAFWVYGTVLGSFLAEATLIGGRDQIRLAGFAGVSAVGDAEFVGDYGVLIGGADLIVSDVTGPIGPPLFSFGAPQLIGDAYEVGTEGSVTGGADSITGSNYAFVPDNIAGDVQNSFGHVIGGRDFIYGRAGQDRIAGDVSKMYSSTLIGGADVIRGGEDSDLIAGDVFQVVRQSAALPLVIAFTGGNDQIFGDNGNDVIAGDILSGDPATASTFVNGNDTLFGNDGDDQLFGDSLLVISALTLPVGGNDILDGGLGDDYLDGQDGNDTVAYNSISAAVFVNLAAGFSTGQGADTLFGIENVIGSALNDTLRGNEFANRFTGGLGNDVIDGGADTDTAIYSEKTTSVSVTLNGAALVNVNVGGLLEDRISNIESIVSGSGNDTLIGDALANDLTGGAGNDFLQGKGGPDDLDGGLGIDTASFADSAFAVQTVLNGSVWVLVDNSGGGNEDTIRSIENLIGSAAGDTLAGDFLVNSISGGNGNDLIRGAGGNDLLDGGPGADTADYSDKGPAVVATLNGANPIVVLVNGIAEDTISGFENLRGGLGADTLTGDANANRLEGGSANDILRGEANNDVLIGGSGNDTLTGGLGVDQFQFLTLSSGTDTITDFLHLTDDIVVSALGFGGGLTAGALAAPRLVANAAPVATQAFGQFLYETDTGRLTWDQNGTGAGGSLLIATLTTLPVLTSLDFLVVA